MEGWISFTGKWCLTLWLLNFPFMNFIRGSLAGCMFRYKGLGTKHYALLMPDRSSNITIHKEADSFLIDIKLAIIASYVIHWLI